MIANSYFLFVTTDNTMCYCTFFVLHTLIVTAILYIYYVYLYVATDQECTHAAGYYRNAVPYYGYKLATQTVMDYSIL